MDTRERVQNVPRTMSDRPDFPVEDTLAEVDDPPDEQSHSTSSFWSTLKLGPRNLDRSRHQAVQYQRRESLLTRQLQSQSETEHTEDEDQSRMPSRGLSTVSNWSNTSAASTAELTSDDGKSVVSPSVSPPLPPSHIKSALHVHLKKLSMPEPKIVGHHDLAPAKPVEANSEKTVEAVLGRRRCITFGCGPEDKTKPPPLPSKEQVAPVQPSPPKRKCMLKFVCPTRPEAQSEAANHARQPRRATSPPPPPPSESKAMAGRVHRGSDSTVTHASSPRSVRKSSASAATIPELSARRFSQDSDDSGPEATRFHEFGTSEEEPEDWTQQSTCHRSRLTISDTLAKENVIRKLAEEAEEEAVDEGEEDDDDDDGGMEDDDNDGDDDDDLGEDGEEDESDEGFHSDDEEGFANSDAESDASEDDWWRPGAYSTAATSAEHFETLVPRPRLDRRLSTSSNASDSSTENRKSRSMPMGAKKLRPRKAINIDNVGANDLPDSTDFVCGTLDEDRPLEQAYLNCVKKKQAAKHRSIPQDIDPTFPTSDPELMDEEDDEDIRDPPESEQEPLGLMHGEMDELDGPRKRSSSLRRRATVHRSPPPQTRHRSPAPAKRSSHHSPPLTARHRSPPPAPRRTVQHSPAPTARRRSPAPRRSTHASPPPRKLFGHSPARVRSPPPAAFMYSPPNSPRGGYDSNAMTIGMPYGLGERRQPTHTASLPKTGVFQISKLATMEDSDDGDGSDTAGNPTVEAPKRRAIDIVKGLERKRQRRKEKLHQKHYAKAAAKPDKAYKVKPGKGAERMREVGLELQRYRGNNNGHILSY